MFDRMEIFMSNVITLCEFFYHAHHIPIYIYEGAELVSFFPDQPSVCYPVRDYQILNQQEKDILCYITPENSLLGYIRNREKNVQLILGPVSMIPYTKNQLAQLFHHNNITKEHSEFCTEFYQQIPCYTNLDFMDILLLLNYITTNRSFTREEYFAMQDQNVSDTASQTYQQQHSDTLDSDDFARQDYRIFHLIEQGDVNGLIQYFHSQLPIPKLSFGENPLQNRKNLCYYSIALFSEAAKRGGVSVMEVMKITAAYFKQITQSNSVEAVDILTTKAALFFAQNVADLAIPNHIKPELIDCIQFIHKNVNTHINVTDVAKHAGYSRIHLTRLFKKELGIDPGSFIRQARLEEAKKMLHYTDKSISEISSFLCYANQSHFHRNFKKQFALTPMQYRQSIHRPPHQ